MTRPPITPGPWEHQPDLAPFIHYPEPTNHFWTPAGGMTVTSAPALREQAEANARAIAALPDLLAALETLAHGLNHDESSNDYQVIKQALTKAGYTF